MEASRYIYDGKVWIPTLTATDHNNFFHSVFGTRADECEAYFDKHAKFRRMRWSTFLTFFENETMPPRLEGVLRNCLRANQKFQHVCMEDKASLAEYISEITNVEQPVSLEEIPILSALENVNVTVLSDKEPDLVTVIRSDVDILGPYPHVSGKPVEVVLCMRENTFFRLDPIEDGEHYCEETVESSSTKEAMQVPKTYVKGGSAGSKGVEFQIQLLTVFFLNAYHKFTNWELSTENKQAGKFDDIVLELSNKNVVVLQAKFKENKKITFDQLLSVNTKHDEFSLPKYFFSYHEIKTKFQIQNIIICTNTYVEKTCLTFLYRQNVSSESMLHYEDGKYNYKCNDNILPYLLEKLNIYYKNNLQRKNIDEAIISVPNMKEFLDKLEIFCKYPAEKELEEVIDVLLQRLKRSSSLWHNISSRDLHVKIMNWFKHPYGEYMTRNRAKAVLSEIRSYKYCEMLDNYNIVFARDDNIFTEPKRIFHIIANDKHLLYLIKIYRLLGNNNSKLLYLNPDDSADVQKQVIRTFGLASYTFLILVWSKIKEESLETEVCNVLADILERYKYKKVILVSENNTELTEQIELISSSYVTVKEPITLDQLSEDTQKTLLKKKNVIFQGYDISLEDLFINDITGDFKEAVKSEMLEKLVRDEKIKVGSEMDQLYEDRYYIDRDFKRQGRTRSEIISMDKIYDVNEKIILIADSAGTGKTTVLTKLAMDIKKKHPHLWVIKIELNDYIGLLRDLLRKNVETISVTDLLNYKESTRITDFERFVFSMRGKVVLILDGIDEISPDYTGLIVSLITQCTELPNFTKIFLTARPHMTEELEENFSVKPFFLQPFTKQNQISFLSNFWMLNLNLEDELKTKCEQYADALIRKMALWTELYQHKEAHFAAIPLQVKMLAEIFQENKQLNVSSDWQGCQEYLKAHNLEPKLPMRMNITKLYEIVIDKKREVYMNKWNPKGHTAANDEFNEECLSFHRMLAVQTVLDKSKYPLFSFDQICKKSIVLNTLKIGIVQKLNDQFYFVHRTYAEYFVAQSLLRELELRNNSEEFQKFFIEEILFLREFNTIRYFLDSCFQNLVYSLPSNVFIEYQSAEYEIDLSRWRKFNLIHRLAKEGCALILQLVFKCIRDNATNTVLEIDFDGRNQKKVFGNTLSILRCLLQQHGVDIKDEFQRTPLHYASENGHVEVVKFLVKEGANVNYKDRADIVPLRDAVRCGHFEVTKHLIEHGAELKVVDRLGHTVLFEAIYGNHLNIAAYILNSILEQNGMNARNSIIPYTAAYLGDLDILKALLNKRLNVNTRIGNGESLIYGAVRGSQLEAIDLLIQQGADINSKDEDGNTPLFLVVSKGHLDLTKFLVEHDAHINVRNKEDRTVLHFAASWGQKHVVEYLVDNGAIVNTTDKGGNTALFLAAEEGLLDIVEFLLDHNADVNIKNNDNRTALFFAAEEGELETVRLLVTRGADINCRDKEGCTALFLAAEEGELGTVKYLVESGADVDAINSDGHTAMHMATFSRRFEIVKYFMECGADMSIRDRSGRDVLMLAAKEGQLDIVKFFVRADVQINNVDHNGSSALHLATLWRHLGVIRFLVERGADINLQDNSGWTALHLAVSKCSLNVIMFLIENGADVKIKMADERTVQFLAVKRGEWDIIRFFIGRLGMDINVRDKAGRTPLHYAALSGDQHIVQYLVQQGADIAILDLNGNTAAMLAKRKLHRHLVKYLEPNAAWKSFLCMECLK